MANSDPGGDAADRHRRFAAAFAERAGGVTDWSGSTPVAEWRVHDIVEHLIEWLPGFLAGGADLVVVPVDLGDPAAAWVERSATIQAILDDRAAAGATFEHPQVPATTVGEAIDRYYTTDVFLHTWDLARASGQDDRLDPATCAELLAGIEPLDDVLRQSGQYGPRVPVAADADVQSRLLAFIGRDPHWGR